MAEANDDWRHDAAHETAHAAHEREHELVTTSHRNSHQFAFENHEKEHLKLAEDLKETARELSLSVRETAERLAVALQTTADLHLVNHEREHANHEREHVAGDRSIDKASEALAERLTSMNKYREQLQAQAATFMTREGADLAHKAMDEKVASIQKWVDGQVGKSMGMAPLTGIVLTVITAVAVLIATRFIFPGGN